MMNIRELVENTAYAYLPIELKNILVLAAADYKLRTGVEPTIKAEVFEGDGGSVFNPFTHHFDLYFPSGSGGIYPVASVAGKPTFAQYDNMVGPVHELGHVLLHLLGAGTNKDDDHETDELNISVLAEAVRVAKGDLKILKEIMLGETYWTIQDKLDYAKFSDSSYENLYNTQI